MTTPFADPGWQAARNGLPGDSTAVNHAAQIGQFLATHGVTPVYAGNRVFMIPANPPATVTAFFFIDNSLPGSAGWLPDYDVDQPFTMPAGVTAIGRAEVPVQAAGSGADLQVTLYPDNGSGAPNTASPLASAIVPAAHITQLSAAGSLASAGPVATARYNTCYLAGWVTSPWTQPAVSLNGSGTFAAPVTSGNFTVFLGGYDATASAAIATVAAVQYLGNGKVSGAMSLPSLPQAAWALACAATPDTIIAAGGQNQSGAHFSAVWTAPWNPAAGTLGAWSAQQALPQPVVAGAMATWNDYVYVAGGSTAGTSATSTASVWYAQVSNSQITAWTAGPPLPQPLSSPYMAVIGDWLIVAGGVNTSGTNLSQTWYAAIGANGIPGPWQAGPALPLAVSTEQPGWNLAVTDSAMLIISGPSASGPVEYTQVLAVSADGPAPEWQVQNWGGSGASGDYQCAAYPAGTPGSWEVVVFHLASYDSAPLTSVPLISVPLPASGLTPGNTYHLMFRQLGGDAVNNYLQLGEWGTFLGGLEWLYAARGSGGPWTAYTEHGIALSIYDQTPAGQPLHLSEDSGARVVSFVWSASSGALLGALESTAFPSGSPEAVLAGVTQVSYGSNGLPSGLTQLA